MRGKQQLLSSEAGAGGGGGGGAATRASGRSPKAVSATGAPGSVASAWGSRGTPSRSIVQETPYIPLELAKEKLSTIVQEVAELKKTQLELVTTLESNFESIEEQTEKHYVKFITALKAKWHSKLQRQRQLLKQTEHERDEALSSLDVMRASRSDTANQVSEEIQMAMKLAKRDLAAAEAAKAQEVEALTRSLERQRQMYEDEIDEIQREVNDKLAALKQQHEAALKQARGHSADAVALARMQQERDAALGELERLRDAGDGGESDGSGSQAQLAQLSAQRDAAMAQIDALRDEAEQLRRQVEQQQLSARDESSLQVSQQPEAMQQLTQQRDELQQRCDAVQSERDQLQSKCEAVQSECDDWRNKFKSALREAAETGSTGAAADAAPDLKHLQANKAALKAQIKAWFSEFKQREGREPSKQERGAIKHLYVDFKKAEEALKQAEAAAAEAAPVADAAAAEGGNAVIAQLRRQLAAEQELRSVEVSEAVSKAQAEAAAERAAERQALQEAHEAEREQQRMTMRMQLDEATEQVRQLEHKLQQADQQQPIQAAAAAASDSAGASNVHEEMARLRRQLAAAQQEIQQLRGSRQQDEDVAPDGKGKAAADCDAAKAGDGGDADTAAGSKARDEADTLRKENAALQERVTKLEAKVTTAKKALKEQMAKAAGKGGGGGSDADAKKAVKKLNEDLAKAQDATRRAEASGKKQEAEILRLKKAADKGKEDARRVKELEAKLAKSTAEAKASAGNATKDLERQLADERNAAKRAASEASARLEKEAKAAADAAGKLNRSIAAKEAALADATAQLATTASELAAATAEGKKMQAELAELRKVAGSAAEHAAKAAEATAQLAELRAAHAKIEADYKDEQVLRKKYFNQIEDMKGKIRVYARCRPMSGSEKERGCTAVVTMPDQYTLEMQHDKGNRSFQYDAVFGPSDSNDKVFEDVSHLVQSAVDGYNVCIFAYGQTGSGKTYTMCGNTASPGITPRAMQQIFDTVQRDGSKFVFELSVYMLELYNDGLIDLLLPKGSKPVPLAIKKTSKNRVTVQGATVLPCASFDEMNAHFKLGESQRHVTATKMNAESSRSHLIFAVLISTTNRQTGSKASGKLNLVDLAGSERLDKTGAVGQTVKEAQSINTSLSALGDVIKALSSGESFIPYRNNKLTQLMSDSLGGEAKTLMFVNISPADYNFDETKTSLTYASRVKLITNDASKAVESKEVARLKNVIKRLKGAAADADDLHDLELEDGIVAGAAAPQA